MTVVDTYPVLLSKFKPTAIDSKAEHRRALARIDHLMRKRRRTRAEDKLLDLLATLVVHYEEKRVPLPDVRAGQMIAHLIEARQTSQAALARAIEVPRSTINNVVAGGRSPSGSLAKKLAAYFKLPMDFFLDPDE